ncbi:MAG: ArsR/SmtB family transcription factor [Bacilli bacterium]
MDSHEYAKVFKALSDPSRVQILLMLSQKTICACQFYKQLGVSQPTASHHLKSLIEANIITGQKEGKWIHYSLNKEVIAKMLLFFDFLDVGDLVCACQEGI